MKNLFYFFSILFLFSSCIKDEDEVPDTSKLPKRIKSAIFYDHNVETQRIEYTYYLDKIVKAEFYSKNTGKWELVNELIYEYALPKVTLTINFNLMGSWTTTAKIEYEIDNGRIVKMDDYTHFYDTWRHDMSTSYVFVNDLLKSYQKDYISFDTVSTRSKYEFDYNDNEPSKSVFYIDNGDGWSISRYFEYDYSEFSNGGFNINEFRSDSIFNSQVKVTTEGGLITKRETYLNDDSVDPLKLDKTETFRYFQVDHLLYSDIETEFQFKHVNYYYENAKGNASWFTHPEESLAGIPRPKGKEAIAMMEKLLEMRKR